MGLVEYFRGVTGLVPDPSPLAPFVPLVLIGVTGLLPSFDPRRIIRGLEPGEGVLEEELWGGGPKSRPP